MKNTIITVLGFRTDSISIKDVSETVRKADTPFKKLLQNGIKRNWWFYGAVIAISYAAPAIFLKDLPSHHLKHSYLVSTLGMGTCFSALFGTLVTGHVLQCYVPSKNKSLQELTGLYKACIWDILLLNSLAGYEDKKTAEVFKKIQHIRRLPQVIHREALESTAYENYKKAYVLFMAKTENCIRLKEL